MAFTGKVIFRPNSDLILAVDTIWGTTDALISTDPRIPDSMLDHSVGTPRAEFGNIFPLGDGNFLVAVRNSDQIGTTQYVMGFVVDVNLNPTGTVWETPYSNEFWAHTGYVVYDIDDGVYDPVTGLNWCARTTYGLDKPWEFNGYDSQGVWQQGRGDTSLIPIYGDGYFGAFSDPINMSLLGRWLYRFATYGDGVDRYNLDTDEWQAILPEWMPNRDDGYACVFAGVDTTQGKLITVRENYKDARNGWIEIRDPDVDPWMNPVPDGISTRDAAMGPAEHVYDPRGGVIPAEEYVLTVDNSNSRWMGIAAGKIYYFSNGRDYGSDENGNWYGNVATLWAMNLADGTVEKAFDVPYGAYDTDGEPLETDIGWNDPRYATDNYCNAPEGVIVMPRGVPTGGPIDGRNRFW